MMQLEETPNGVEFDWGLAGAAGAWFVLYPKQGHTKQDCNNAKAWLRTQRDVVSCRVATVGDWYERFRSEVFRDPRTKHLHWSQMEFEMSDWKAIKDELTVEEFVTRMLPKWEAITTRKSLYHD